MSQVRPLHIVLVEDNSADVCLIEQSLLEHAIDFRLKRFEGGEEALEHLSGLAPLRSDPPDLVLLDLHLPGTDGPAVLQAIRAEPWMAGVPVVVLTGACPENLHNVDLEGARRIVHKSMDLDEYLRNVGGAVLDLFPGRWRGRVEASPA
jgi:CheY-like chemotaxis protein